MNSIVIPMLGLWLAPIALALGGLIVSVIILNHDRNANQNLRAFFESQKYAAQKLGTAGKFPVQYDGSAEYLTGGRYRVKSYWDNDIPSWGYIKSRTYYTCELRCSAPSKTGRYSPSQCSWTLERIEVDKQRSGWRSGSLTCRLPIAECQAFTPVPLVEIPYELKRELRDWYTWCL